MRENETCFTWNISSLAIRYFEIMATQFWTLSRNLFPSLIFYKIKNADFIFIRSFLQASFFLFFKEIVDQLLVKSASNHHYVNWKVSPEGDSLILGWLDHLYLPASEYQTSPQFHRFFWPLLRRENILDKFNIY